MSLWSLLQHESRNSHPASRWGSIALSAALVVTLTGVTVPANAATIAKPVAAASVVHASTVKCHVDANASDRRLSILHTTVVNVSTGRTLYSRYGSVAIPMASVNKLATSTAAVLALGKDFRFVTKVVTGSRKGQIVLVGGGDPTLSSTGRSVYAGAAKISTLTDAVAAWAKAHKISITSVVLDSTYFNGSNFHSNWQRNYLTYGYVSKITALQVDGDRANPSVAGSKRSTDPVGHAGRVFASALAKSLKLSATQAKHLTVTRAKAPKKASIVASVKSQPLPTLLRQTLLPSDNTLAEALGFMVAKKMTGKATFGNLNRSYKTLFKRAGITVEWNMWFSDGSGLSQNNRMTPLFLTRLLRAAATNKHGLGVVLTAMPVAGKLGSLSNRFASAYSKPARGHVVAKTGYIDGVTSLAGIITAKDGTELAFVEAVRNSRYSWSTQAATIDNLAAKFYRCGAGTTK